MQNSPVSKVIIPVAGLGTRFLPATKAQPKEMLPVVDKPAIQYIVEEVVASGIRDIVLITGAQKRAIEDHFDRNRELEDRLREQGKTQMLEAVQRITKLANIYYVRQKEQLGDGHAILSAKNLIKDEAVGVMFGDEIVDSKTPVLKQLMDVYNEVHAPVIAVMQVPTKEVSMYGIVEGVEVKPNLWKVTKLTEKPLPKETRSRLAIVGKYIITPNTLQAIELASPSHHGELRLIDGFRSQLKKEAIYAYAFEGKRYDCGNKLQFLQATVAMALKHPEVKEAFRAFLKTIK